MYVVFKFFLSVFTSIQCQFLCFMMVVIACRYFHDFQQRIPRDEMVQLKDIAVAHVEKEDEKFVANVCGSFRRGIIIAS